MIFYEAERQPSSVEITVRGETVPDSQILGFGEIQSKGLVLVNDEGIIYFPFQNESLTQTRNALNKSLEVITAIANEVAVVGKAPIANPDTAAKLVELNTLIAGLKYE